CPTVRFEHRSVDLSEARSLIDDCSLGRWHKHERRRLGGIRDKRPVGARSEQRACDQGERYGNRSAERVRRSDPPSLLKGTSYPATTTYRKRRDHCDRQCPATLDEMSNL